MTTTAMEDDDYCDNYNDDANDYDFSNDDDNNDDYDNDENVYDYRNDAMTTIMMKAMHTKVTINTGMTSKRDDGKDDDLLRKWGDEN